MRVLKWKVPVDNAAYRVGSGKVVHVDLQGDLRYVYVWTEESEDAGLVDESRRVRVFATGQRLPFGAEHLGSISSPGGAIVWHLYELAGVED